VLLEILVTLAILVELGTPVVMEMALVGAVEEI
jgi:hypothetical protein